MTVQPLRRDRNRVAGESALQHVEHAVPLLAQGVEASADDAERFSAGSGSEVKDFRYYLGQVYVHLESYTDRRRLHRAGVPGAAAGAVFDVAAVRHGHLRRPDRWSCAPRHPPLRRRARSGFIYHRAKASLMPLAVLPWVGYLAAGQRKPVADPAAECGAAGAGDGSGGGEFQEVPLTLCYLRSSQSKITSSSGSSNALRRGWFF